MQWLKLMLTTLNFDTAKEGYTGTGWDVNVLNRANEVGLTAGLAKDWKAIAPIKRGEAAQVLYNALTKYLVEYGQLVKNNYDTTSPVLQDRFHLQRAGCQVRLHARRQDGHHHQACYR